MIAEEVSTVFGYFKITIFLIWLYVYTSESFYKRKKKYLSFYRIL